MNIRRRGRQPDEGFAAVPNEAARDTRLPWAARGILTYLLSHRPGWSITTADVQSAGSAGREAVRRAFRELEEAGYIRRIRERDERGRIVRWIDLYPYGDAPPVADDADPDPIPEDEPSDGFPGDGFPGPGSLGPFQKTTTEEQPPPSTSEMVAADPSRTGPTSPTRGGGDDEEEPAAVPKVRDSLPVVLQRKLQDMGVTDGTLWTQAWQTALSLQWPEFAEVEAENFPQEHLMMHLLAQQEQGRAPSPSRWMRFYVEDRRRRIDIIAGDIERLARMEETPQEREDRLNRRLPPADWGTPQSGTGDKQ